MGVEWTLACVGCRQFAWLGSMKPYKWSGFQMGDRFVAELLSLHTAPGCSLIVTSDAEAWEPPWEHDSDTTGWLEDLRSRWFWDSIQHDTTPPRMVCAACEAPLALPSTRDGNALRESGYRAAAGNSQPLVVGRYLWLCGPVCLDRHRRGPGRTWARSPNAAACAHLEVGCLRCGVEIAVGDLDRDPDKALAFAEWLTEHIHRPPAGSGLDAQEACRLVARVDPALR